MSPNRVASTLLSVLVAASGTTAAQVAGHPPSQRVTFERSITNLEYSARELRPLKPEGVTRVPRASGEIGYGTIVRRLPGEGARATDHFVAFMVEHVLGVPARAWCDTNLDGDLTNDPPVSFSAYPGNENSRAFLADLHWIARRDGRDYPIAWKVRVVLEPGDGVGTPPIYRLQMVYAMLGTVTLDGKPHRAVLYDGSGDGLYSKDFFDGLFVDLDDDRHFDIDPMSPGFGPIGAPFQMGSGIYEVASIDPEGRELTLRETATVTPADPPRIGAPAPSFSFKDTAGREIRLSDYRGRYVVVLFWASWCGNFTSDIGALKALEMRYRPRGVAIVGISYDTDRQAMEAFRARERLTWPTSFSGRMFWEDPIGRLYQAKAAGTAYLVDPEGRLRGIDGYVEKLGARLAAIFPGASATSHKAVAHGTH